MTFKALICYMKVKLRWFGVRVNPKTECVTSVLQKHHE